MTEPEQQQARPDDATAAETVRDVVRDCAPTERVDFGDDLRLIEDLGYHSLALLEMSFILEDEFRLPPIDREQAQQIVTVRDVVDYVVAALREADPPA